MIKQKKKLNAKVIDKEKNIIKVEKKITNVIQNFDFYKRKTLIMNKVQEWITKKLKPDKLVLIIMELANGHFIQFLILEENEGFIRNGKKYLFDDSLKFFMITTNQWCYYFHENMSLPIKMKIPVNEIRTTLEATDITDVEYAINPSTLERFETSKIAEGIMKGQQIDEFMKKVMTLLFLIGLAVVIHFIVYLFTGIGS